MDGHLRFLSAVYQANLLNPAPRPDAPIENNALDAPTENTSNKISSKRGGKSQKTKIQVGLPIQHQSIISNG
jgi:hypothetical protein